MMALLFCAAALVFAGAGREQGSGGGKETLDILWTVNTQQAGVKQVMDEIEKRFGIVSELEIRPGGSEGETVVKTRLASGSMSDLFIFNTGSKTNDINPEKYCADLSAYKPKLDNGYIVSASVNGKLYSVPVDYSAYAGIMMYHKGVYQKLGLQIPKTWAEFLANCDKIQAAGITPILGTMKDTWTSQLIFLQEEYYIEAAMSDWPQQYTANKAKYATVPAALRSFEKLAETSRYLNKDYLATTLAQGLEMLANGEAAHFPMQAHRLAALDANHPDKIGNIGAFAQPGNDPNNTGITVWMPNGFYVNNQSKKIETAKKWIDFLLTEEAWNLFTSVQKPGGPSVVKGFKLPANVIPGVRDTEQYFNSGHSKPALEFVSPIKGPGLEQFCIEVVTGRMSPQDAAKAYDQDVQKQAVLLNLPGW
jgi:raffinose/stachyose/melibiose transport system substrate-binding protein